MTKKTRNESTSYGLEILKRAVLLVLYEAEEGLDGREKLQYSEIIK